MSKVLARSARVLQAADRTEHQLNLELMRHEDALEAREVAQWLEDCLDLAFEEYADHVLGVWQEGACFCLSPSHPWWDGELFRYYMSEATSGFVKADACVVRYMFAISVSDLHGNGRLHDRCQADLKAARWPRPYPDHDLERQGDWDE